MLSKKNSFLKPFKWIALVVITYVIFQFVSSTTANAAGNWTDTLFKFESTRNYYAAGTEFRGKWDYTSCYAYNQKSSINFQEVEVVGRYGNSTQLCTYGSPKGLPIGSAYYFPNLVKERGYTQAALNFCHWDNYTAVNYYVWWSPDSI